KVSAPCFFLWENEGAFSCPLNLGLLKSRLEEQGWHTTTAGRIGNGCVGKKRRKRYCVSAAWMKRLLSKSAQTTGQSSIPTGVTIRGNGKSAHTLKQSLRARCRLRFIRWRIY